ncbi:MAG TPA: hypothetical protein VHF89_06530 [Solirubrobacteraceae bacterium]|nr:hypothetical protein [Solirubrobacteraceae bacterium]
MAENGGSPIKLSLAPMAPEIEAQLYSAYIKPIAAGVIRRLYEYLAANVQGGGAKELQPCVPLVGGAVQVFQAGDYPRALQQAYVAYRYVTVVRTHKPELPPLELAAATDR